MVATPRLIAIGGLSGSGKSTLARDLTKRVAARVLRSDVIRKELMGVAETTRLGPTGYGPTITAEVYATLFDRARTAVTAGQSVILDAVFSKQHERERAEALAQELGVPFCGLWLDVPLAVALARIEARTDDASDATPRVRIMQEERLERPVLWTHLMGAEDSAVMLVEQALQQLKPI